MESGPMLQHVFRIQYMKKSIENSLRNFLGTLTKIRKKDIKFNNPLYYLTLPGLLLKTFGLYMGLSFLRNLSPGATINFLSTALIILITIIGAFMAFAGILMHSIGRLLKYKMKNR